MRFHLDYTVPPSQTKIDHRNHLLLMGSCFTEHIGELLLDHKFITNTNPDGILFNPLSIYESLNRVLHHSTYDQQFIFERQGTFLSYRHHSSINAATESELIQKINSTDTATHQFLKKTDWLIISFGTAFAYHHKKLEAVVANCHKQESVLFEKKLLDVELIVKLYGPLLQDLQRLNPKLKVLFTVSPVKHLRDGIEQNSISKATLLLAIHQLRQLHAFCFYFPAFELVNDDLRDHRFYEKDLAHPNQLAIE